MSHVVIIGNGAAGVSAALALRAKQSSGSITIISKESPYFFSRPALMYIYMGHMTVEQTQPYESSFWKAQNISLIQNEVVEVDYTKQELKLQDNSVITYTELVLATGSASNFFGWPGQEATGVQGFYSMNDLKKMETHTKDIQRAVVVGGGLIGVEVAEMLLSRNIPVTFLVREELFWSAVLPPEESKMIGRHIQEHHVDLRLGSELQEIVKDASGRVEKIITTEGEEIACQFVGITVGVHPNIDFVKESVLECERGILIDHQFKTSIPHVYAVGDCAQFRGPLPGRRPVEQVWYTAKAHGETLGAILGGGDCKYTPGIWFNSAKFFDIEYQTYGMVLPKPVNDEATFVWEDSKEHRLMRVTFKKEGEAVTGFNFFGIRARHEICEKWIAEARTITYVMEHLGALNFDPEFFIRFEESVIECFNRSFGPVSLTTPKGLQTPLWKRLWNKKGVVV
ncbi:MAG: NAD(P)/FAD-dependent oxidoreductase [Fibrobacterales bacterium]